MSGDYEVGYKRPPRHTRFRKGRSGNPKGRPRHVRNLLTDLHEELQQQITVREDGTERRVSRGRAVIMRLLDRALKGDLGAMVKVVDLMQRQEAAAASGCEPEAPLSAEEWEVVADLKARLLRQPADSLRDDEPAASGNGTETPP